ILQNSQDNQDKIKFQEQNISTLYQEIAHLKQTISVQASEICEKDKYLETLKNETTCMQSNYRNLVNIISEKDQKIKQFEYNLESLKNISENDSSNHKIKISKNEVQLHVLQKTLKNKIEVFREYENKITSLENEIDNFKNKLMKHKWQIQKKQLRL
ncbi:hypothetical protein C1645_829334, partial [Glomus cerebriforme]